MLRHASLRLLSVKRMESVKKKRREGEKEEDVHMVVVASFLFAVLFELLIKGGVHSFSI